MRMNYIYMALCFALGFVRPVTSVYFVHGPLISLHYLITLSELDGNMEERDKQPRIRR
jgi:hypothetical protein